METGLQFDGNTLIGDILGAVPGSRRLLGRMGVDTARWRGETLGALCGAMGLSLRELLRGLESLRPGTGPSGPARWQSASLDELLRHIVDTHHAYTRSELARLEDLLAKSLEERAGDEEAARIHPHFGPLKHDLLAHLAYEERHLFPAIRDMRRGGPVPPALSTPEALFATMRGEHEAAEELFYNIGLHAGEYGASRDASPSLLAFLKGLRDLEEDLFRHIYLENIVLYPRVLEEARSGRG